MSIAPSYKRITPYLIYVHHDAKYSRHTTDKEYLNGGISFFPDVSFGGAFGCFHIWKHDKRPVLGIEIYPRLYKPHLHDDCPAESLAVHAITPISEEEYEIYVKISAYENQPVVKDILPCKEPCPKCGSADILINFIEKGERFDVVRYGIRPDLLRFATWLPNTDPNATHSTSHYATVEMLQECLHHHCRTCQAKWYGETL